MASTNTMIYNEVGLVTESTSEVPKKYRSLAINYKGKNESRYEYIFNKDGLIISEKIFNSENDGDEILINTTDWKYSFYE